MANITHSLDFVESECSQILYSRDLFIRIMNVEYSKSNVTKVLLYLLCTYLFSRYMSKHFYVIFGSIYGLSQVYMTPLLMNI